jgi:hypothetical protein
MNKLRLLVQVIVVVGIVTGCDSCDGDFTLAENDTLSATINNKTITIDYSGSGLTQAQADNNVTPKLEETFNAFTTLATGAAVRDALDVMVNKSGFKIVIIPGNSGCARVGDTMTLGANFLLTNNMQNIGNSIQSALMNGIFV